MFWAPGVIVLLLGHTCLGLEVIAPPSVIASLRSPVVLPCNFSIAAPSINSQFLAIIWYYKDQILLTIDNKGIQDKQGFYINEQEAKKGNATLTIHNVTIADQGTYKCLIIYSPDRQQREIKLNVHAPPQNMIQRKALDKGQKSQLFCFISDFFPEEVKVTWLRNNAPIQGGSEMGALHRNADGTYRVNSSVVLTPDQIQDRPTIVCQVEHVSLKQPIKDAYTVQFGVAPKVRLFPSKTSDNNELIYVCEARGFSPEPLTINWLVNGKSVDLSRVSEDGVFNKRIYYQINLKEDNMPDQISCNVQHETLRSPIKETTEVNTFNECTRNCHLGLTWVLIALLIVSLLFIGLLGYLIKKKKYFRLFEVSHIHQEQAWDDKDMVTLYCMALNCPEVAQTIWTINIDGREPITMQDCQEYKDEEKGPLLHPGYIMRTDQTKSNGLSNFTTKLSFNPETSGYKKMDIKCKFLCGRRSKERSLMCTFQIKKPEMKDFIYMFLDGNKDIVCSVTLDKFSPRNIQIKWSFKGDQSKDLESTEEITHNTEDHTYKAVSTCKIPQEELKNSSRRVQVTWKHLSMDQPKSHEVTLEDTLSYPVMEDIVVSPLIHGTEAKLQCDIRGYSTKDLKVTWLRREAGKSDLYEVSASDKYKIPVIDSKLQPDKMYTCTASLILSVSGITEHGSEFICRVTHPSLETYVERRTGELSVKGKAEISEICLNDNYIVLKITNLYTPDLMVTWKKADNEFGPYKEVDETRITDEQTKNDDGSLTHTNKYQVLKDWKKTMHMKKKKNKFYKVTVTHGSLNPPKEIVFFHSEGNVYKISGNEKELLINQKPSKGRNRKDSEKREREPDDPRNNQEDARDN